jgi:glycosyltransferase involved in cell wall biosynthesis
VTLVEGTRALGPLISRVIYATDAAQPAASRPFRRLTTDDLPEGAMEIPLRIFRTVPPRRLAFSPGLWYALQSAIPQADLVTIHSLNLFPQFAAFTTAIRARIPYVVTPHGALDPWLGRNSPAPKRLANATWQRRMLAHAGAIHFTTAEEAELAGEIAARSPHIVVPNGLNLARFSTSRSGRPFRDKHLDGYAGPVVMFLGRIAKKKGIDLLIRAFARVVNGYDARLVIAGPDDEGLAVALVSLAASLDVLDRVTFVGPVYGEAQLCALAAADVWALTSHTENFGNAVIEAMASSCPVVISDHVNLAGQVRSADAGLVTSLAIEDISHALIVLLRSREARESLGRRGAAFANQFDWTVVAPKLADAFARVSATRLSSAGPAAGIVPHRSHGD